MENTTINFQIFCVWEVRGSERYPTRYNELTTVSEYFELFSWKIIEYQEINLEPKNK